MAQQVPFTKATVGLSDEERVALILELTRRMHLLDELLQAAREKRQAVHEQISLADVQCDELDMVTLH